MKLKSAIAIVVAGALAPAASVWAQDNPPPLVERTAQSDLPLEGARAVTTIRHASLSISVEPQTHSIEGIAYLEVVPRTNTESLQFDLDPRYSIPRITVDDVALDDSDYSNTDGLLTLALPETAQAGDPVMVWMQYSGQPHEATNPPWEGGFVWSQTEDGQPWIATAVQGEGCDLLWPCIDHSSHRLESLDLMVTVPDGLTAAGNGRLYDIYDNLNGSKTFHWQARDPSNYGIALQIGPYEVAQRNYESRYGNTIPLTFWHLPGNAEGADRLLDEMAEQIAFMEATFGPYPFGDEKAGVVETPHLGMEHQTINAYGNGFRPEAYGHDWLLQHEFAHEWFANQLRNATVNHMWLAEGITTWTQPLYLEHARGRMFYHAEMWKLRQRVWSRVPLVPPEGELPDYNDREAMWGDDIYFKGAWIMHTLRYLAGDGALFPAITRLTYGTSVPTPGEIHPLTRTTDDFRAILEDITAEDLGWFFDAYFYQADLPRLDIRQDGATVSFEWVTPSDLPFEMPLEVRVGGSNRTLMMAGGRGDITLPSAEAHFLADPDNRILKYDAAVDAWQNRETEG